MDSFVDLLTSRKQKAACITDYENFKEILAARLGECSRSVRSCDSSVAKYLVEEINLQRELDTQQKTLNSYREHLTRALKKREKARKLHDTNSNVKIEPKNKAILLELHENLEHERGAYLRRTEAIEEVEVDIKDVFRLIGERQEVLEKKKAEEQQSELIGLYNIKALEVAHENLKERLVDLSTIYHERKQQWLTVRGDCAKFAEKLEFFYQDDTQRWLLANRKSLKGIAPLPASLLN
jgi:hypothetical protein